MTDTQDRKKYFSSVERLRLLQQAASQRRQRQSTPRESVDTMRTRPSTSHSWRPRPLFSDPDVPLLEDVSEEQALRFLALPDKIKRTHFSTEELVLLTQSSNRALRRLHAEHSRSPTWSSSDRSMSAASSRSRETSGLEKDWLEDGANTPMSVDFRRSEPNLLRTCDVQQRQSSFSSSRSMASSPIDDLPRSSSRKSFSRKRALAPLPLPPPTLLPAVPPLPQPNVVCEKEPTPTPSPVDGSHDTRARYYGDSDARSKLRAFLASPEKFDEALEFGFPSVDSSHNDEHDGSLQTTTESSSTMPQGPMDSGLGLPLHTKKIGNIARSITPDLDGREMTLKLTLTREDLRAPEEARPDSSQRRQVFGVDFERPDPLALSSLVICDDHSGSQGAFAIKDRSSKRGLKKVWDNICKR